MRVLGPVKKNPGKGTFSLCQPPHAMHGGEGSDGGERGLHVGAWFVAGEEGVGGRERTAEYSVQGPREEGEGPRSLFDQPESEGIVRD